MSGEAKGDHRWLVVTPEQVLGKAEDEVLELAPGDWELEVSPSFNPDGSMSKGTEEPVKVDLNGTDEEQATGVDYSPEVIEAADVTEEAYKKAVDDVRVMVTESDGKVPDKVLAGTLEDAEASWAKAQEAAAAKKAEEEARKKEAEEAAKDTEKPEGGEAAEGGSKAQSGSQGGGQSNATKPSGGSSSQASAPKQPSHQHSWTPVYRNEPVFGTEPVYENQPVHQTVEVAVCTTCGVEISGDPNQHLLDTGHSSWKSSVKQVQTGTQQVQVGTKQVQTGTTQVLDHYVCSGCGATK